MSVDNAVLLLIIAAVITANLPWLSERILLVKPAGEGGKHAAWRWLEWLILYLITGAVAMGLEQKINGERHDQGWEFYAVTLCLFLVFALPGFLYRHDLKPRFSRR